MLPPALAEKTNNEYVSAVLAQATKQAPTKIIVKAQTGTATAVMYEVGKGFKMIRPMVYKEWWEELHPRHKYRINSTLIVFFLGLIDLMMGLFSIQNLFHWLIDILIIWGSISVFLTAILLAKRYR
jgi:hypothetical protein